MILVDTSAWVEFFRGRPPIAAEVDAVIDTNDAALCGPVVMELRRGFRSARERNRVLPLLGGCRWLDQPPRLWEEAGDLGFLLARRGFTAKSFDLLIATYALTYSIALLTADRDFSKMRKVGVNLLLA